MADISVASDGDANLEQTGPGLFGPFWISETEAVIVYHNSSDDLAFARTTNGGASWSTGDLGATNLEQCSAFFDREVPGDTGTLVHVAWANSTGGDSVLYANIDVSDGSTSTPIEISTSVSYSGSSVDNRIAIGKTVSGNLILAYVTGTEDEAWKSSNGGSSWSSIASPFDDSSSADFIMLYPADTGDGNDCAAILHDVSGNQLFCRIYDDSANSWSSTSISTGITGDSTYRHWDAAVRHSDGAILLAAHNDADTSTDDIKTFEILPDSTSSPTITAKTDVVSNVSEAGFCGVLINQQDDTVYVAFTRGSSFRVTTGIYYYSSSNGMSSWSSETKYSEDTDDDIRGVSAGRSVGDSGGYFMPCWNNDDLTEIFSGTTNAVLIEEAAAADPNSVTLSAGSISATENAPGTTTTEKNFITLAAGTLSATNNAPQVTATETNSVTLAAGSLSTTANNPQASNTENRVSSLGAGALTASANSPQADTTEKNFTTLAAGSLSASEAAPEASVSASNQVNVTAGSLSATLNNPQASNTENRASQIGQGALTATNNAPQADTTEKNFITLSAGSLATSANNPQVSTTEGDNANIATGSLAASGNAPQAVTTENKAVSLSPGALTASANNPQADTTEKNFITLFAGTLSAINNAPQATTGDSNLSEITPGTLSASVNSPQAQTTEANRISLSPGSLAATNNAPQVTATANNEASIALASLSATANNPQATATEDTEETVALSAGSISATNNAPQASTTENHFVTLSLETLNTSNNAPQAVVLDPNTANVVAASLTRNSNAPGVTTTENEFSEISAGALSLAGFGPSVSYQPPTSRSGQLREDSRDPRSTAQYFTTRISKYF